MCSTHVDKVKPQPTAPGDRAMHEVHDNDDSIPLIDGTILTISDNMRLDGRVTDWFEQLTALAAARGASTRFEANIFSRVRPRLS